MDEGALRLAEQRKAEMEVVDQKGTTDMTHLENAILKNQQDWNDTVESKGEYTRPWLNLDLASLNEFAEGRLSGFHKPSGTMNIPIISKIRKLIYQDIKGKNVLCLASGGGQQSAVFALLGANVTVADISQGQLTGDLIAAEHYGYQVKTVLCSMTDLSAFEDESFDIVYQPVSICFVPDVLPVYQEAYRVLKKGGIYCVAHQNPATYVVDFNNDIDGWDGIGYRIATPYKGGAIRVDENGKENMDHGEMTGEFRHLFIDIFCQLTETGFAIKYIWEDERNFVGKEIDEEEPHEQDFSVVQKYINTLSIK